MWVLHIRLHMKLFRMLVSPWEEISRCAHIKHGFTSVPNLDKNFSLIIGVGWKHAHIYWKSICGVAGAGASRFALAPNALMTLGISLLGKISPWEYLPGDS